GFEDDEAGPEPDYPGDTPRVRGNGNTSTRRWIVVPFMGRWAEPSRPGIDAGSPEWPRPVRSPLSPPQSLVHEASRCGASAGGLKPPPRETPSTGLQPHRAGGGRPAVNGGPARRRQKARELACRSPGVMRQSLLLLGQVLWRRPGFRLRRIGHDGEPGIGGRLPVLPGHRLVPDRRLHL